MKIAMIVKYWAGFGGVETFCVNLLAAARAHSRHVYDMFVFDHIEDAGRSRAPAGTRFHPGRRGLLAILRELWRVPYDVILINQPFALMIVPVLRLRRRVRIAYVIHIDYDRAAGTGTRRRLLPWLLNRYVDVILSMTEDNRAKLAAAGIDTPVAVFAPPLYPAPDGTGPVDYAARPVDLIFFGRMAEQKDPLFFLDMVRRVRARRPDLRVEMIGSGPLDDVVAADLAAHEMDYVTRLPGMPHDQLEGHVKRAKVFVLSSEYEGLGLVMIEAMNWGAQVVSGDIPVGPRELLAETGVLAPRTPEAMAEAVETVLTRLETTPEQPRAAETRLLERYRYARALPVLEAALAPPEAGHPDPEILQGDQR